MFLCIVYLIFGLFLLGNLVVLLIVQDKSSVLGFLVRRRCYFFYHVILSFYLLPLGEYGKQLLAKSFSLCCEVFGGILMDALDKHRERLFEDLRYEMEHDDGVTSTTPFTIVEVGIGFGANFEYYPQPCDLIGVDPVKKHKKTIENQLRMRQLQGIHLKEFLSIEGEDMSPIPDNSADVVVGTLLLCSVRDENAVLAEIRRILKPGGKFYFLEHVLDPPNTLKGAVQRFFNWTHWWEMWMCGCKFNDIEPVIKQSGFKEVKGSEVHLQYSEFSFPLLFLERNYVGTATK